MIGPFDPYSGIDRQQHMNRLASLGTDPWAAYARAEIDKSAYMAEMARRAAAQLKAGANAVSADSTTELLLLIEDETP